MGRKDILEAEIAKLSDEKSLDNLLSHSDDLLSSLKDLQMRIENDEDTAEDLKGAQLAFQDWHDKGVKQEKRVHKALRNYTAKTEKLFPFELDEVYQYRKINMGNDRTEKLIDRAIVMDLLRKGEFDIAKVICKESDVVEPAELEEQFGQLHHILDRIQQEYDLEPAIAWATQQSKQLRQMGSDLEFHLHKVYFLRILERSNGDPFEAYRYAKQTFPRFGAKHLDTISRLIGSLAFTDQPDVSHLISSKEILCERICHDYCSLLKLSAKSPLHNALFGGYMALPSFKKYNDIRKQTKNNLSWTTANELPFEINLPQSQQYHSIFICPVSKEETTRENPPMVLPCRHLISLESLTKMSKNGIASFKCPYCPKTCLTSQAKRAQFVHI